MSGYLNQELLDVSGQLSRLENEQQAYELLQVLQKLDRDVEASLEDTIEKLNIDDERDTVNLDLARAELLTSLSTLTSLKKILLESSYLAKKLTYKVRLLDYERSRVLKTKVFVQNIIDLRKHILIINQSIEDKDWSKVSGSIAFILHEIPLAILLSSQYADIMIPSTELPERPETLLARWIGALKELYVEQFNQAVKARDLVRLTNFFSYFPMIGELTTGLNCYSNFINKIISDQSRNLLIRAPKDKLNFYSAAIMKLFEIVSKIVNQHSAIIVKYYGEEAMSVIITKIQREVDSQAGLIADTFWDVRNFDKTVHDVEGYGFGFLNQLLVVNGYARAASPLNEEEAGHFDSSIEELISVVDVGDYINELSMLMNRWILYCEFIAIKWKEYSGHDPKETKLVLVKPLIESSFLAKLETKLVPCFDKLSQYYLKKSLEKTFKLEQLPDLTPIIQTFLVTSEGKTEDKELEESPVSSVVEDFILIINSVLTNGIESGQPVLLKNLLITLKQILAGYFYKILVIKLKEFQPRQGTNLLNINEKTNTNAADKLNDPNRNVITGNLSSLRNSSDMERSSTPPNVLSNMLLKGASAFNSLGLNDEFKLTNYIIYFNSVSVFKQYFLRMLNRLMLSSDSLLSKKFQFGTDAQRLKQLVTLNLGDYVTKVNGTLVKENSAIFFALIFKNRVKTLLNDFFSYSNSYLVESNENNSGLEVKKFVKTWSILIVPYHKILAKEIFDSVIKLVIKMIAEVTEKKIWLLSKKINLLGVLKLEKDVSHIINETTKYDYSLREHFIRVTQLIMIMGFDDEEDEQEIDWILTMNERKKARHLRIDK